MTRTPRIRTTVAVAGAVIGAVVLAGCSAGQVTQTSRQVTAVDGANANAGPIAVRNAQFPLPEDAEKSAVAYVRGATAPIQLVIVNTGSATDELVSVTSPIATGEVTGRRDVPAGTSILVGGEPASEVIAPTATAGATPSATAGAPTATPTATPTAAAPTTSAAALPPGTAGTAQIVLTGLRDDIKSGITYEVVLNFRNAGPLRLAVPVAGSEAERKDEAEAGH